MNRIIDETLARTADAGNFRQIPDDCCDASRLDLSSNDYLGLGAQTTLQEEFLKTVDFDRMQFTASASRLLARRQSEFCLLESTLAQSYSRPALLFNSGYHANTGLVSAFSGLPFYILADKLVHASIIDGIRLSGLPFARFRHNDFAHLARLADKANAEGKKLIIIAESVSDSFEDVDIIVGTLGKALASSGAFAIVSEKMRQFMVNKARSLIFSTAIPPLTALWSRFTFLRSLDMDDDRTHLRRLAGSLNEILRSVGAEATPSHIQPLIVGSPQKAIAISSALRHEGFDVLPIRTPTVPPGTDRLRFSLSAAITEDQIKPLATAIRKVLTN